MADKPTTLPRLLTVRQVAELTGYTRGAIYNLMENGVIPSVKVNNAKGGAVRIPEAGYLAWYDSLTVRNPIKTRRSKKAA